ncbi:MAG: response regulator [Candidatus Abyssobacteria bacterium SURF_17]|jgi:DNA-binding response OmpR family regulator|uniref:Response regulator n=1 Tax=Candidatus Abyssobacteria bacterium SURF_17 TaxID=2093361 RepID=A0A419F8E3_9BACT|nr:MAG: response regulator [Candidatus Abyssubacteria bacterium SURF_17]
MNTSTPIRVLIVDDEERFRATTASILKKRGFEVIAVGSGIEALEEIKKRPLDVVVLDVKMPGMDGNEALREIKKVKPEIEVIMLTGHGTLESAFEGLREGVFDYLAKPCDIDILARKIQSAYAKEKRIAFEEPRVKHVMVPLSSFSTIHEDCTVAEAINVILRSFQVIMSTTTVHESLHRSALILDKKDKVIGVLSFTDLLEGLQPAYMRLLKDRPLMADSIHLEAPAFSGMFTIMARDLGKKKVRDLMSEAPPTIDANANLMEATSRLLELKIRRLLVMEGEKAVGVIREQDLFFEIANIVER